MSAWRILGLLAYAVGFLALSPLWLGAFVIRTCWVMIRAGWRAADASLQWMMRE